MSYIGTQPVPQSLESRQEFTANASQDTFATNGYTVGYVDVYLNGVKLSTSDFTATNGSDIVLNSDATAGDVLAVVMKNDHSDLVALPITDSAGNNVLSESGGVVTLTADAAVIEGSSSGNLVRITQTGSGNALVVEDSTNPDSTPFVVNSSGNVGIGTSSPGTVLHLVGTSLIKHNYTGVTNGVLIGQFNATGDASINNQANAYLSIATNNQERMKINSSGALILNGSTAQKATGTTWSNPSDQRLKSNISDYPKGTAELMQVRVREWEYNGKGGTVAGTKGLGVVADEIMTVLPNTVDNYEAKLNVDDEETIQIKKFDATEITWLLVKTTQEQQTLIESQQSQIDALTTKTQEQDLTIASLISRIEALETPAE